VDVEAGQIMELCMCILKVPGDSRWWAHWADSEDKIYKEHLPL